MNKTEAKINPSILDLPNEILLEIFSYLDTSYLGSRVQLVCKSWSVISEDASLWKSISFRGSRNVFHIPRVLAKYPNLQSLNIEKGVLNSTVFKAIALLPFLETLRLYECTFFLGSKTAFYSLMNSSLSCLELRKCLIDNEILDIISEAKGLKCLRITYLGKQNLLRILDNCEQLQQLEIDKIDLLSEESVERIFRLRSNTILGVVLYGERRLSDAAFCHIESCVNLSKFSISRCNSMSDLTLSRLGKLTNLKFLELGCGTNFSTEGLRDLFEEPSMTKLVHLDLARCTNLDDSCVCIVADKCQELRSLCLRNCINLTDKSAGHIARKCTRLSTLDLSWITLLIGSFFQDLIVYLRELKILDLRMCHGIEGSRIKMLMTSRPSLTIYKSG